MMTAWVAAWEYASQAFERRGADYWQVLRSYAAGTNRALVWPADGPQEMDKFPAVQDWLKRISERPAVKAGTGSK